jgi:hypothetical protein
MEIEPKYVTFDQAKDLKERGFNLRVVGYSFLIDDKIHFDLGFLNHNKEVKEFVSRISRPEQHQVLEWLLENDNIWIEITMGKDSNKVWFDYDIFSTIKPRKDDELGEEGVEYEEDPNERFLNWDTTHDSLIDEKFEVFTKTSHDSPQEAYSAAFDYILKELI